MKAKTLADVLGLIIGVQFLTTGATIFAIGNKELSTCIIGLICIIVSAVYCLGYISWSCNRLFGKGKWENKEV